MSARSLPRSTPAILAVAMLVSACSASGPGGSPQIAPAAAASSPALVATNSAGTVAPTAPAGSIAAAPSAGQPPAASLAVDGGDPVTGQLGSFTWDGGGSDSPWLPGSRITVGAGERIAVTLAADPGIASWAARRATAGTVDGAGAVAIGQGAGPPSFAAPPTGTWSVQLTVQFASGRGSAAYYWRVTVS
jgi:hypothetical protein